jgi:hypothetical protein
LAELILLVRKIIKLRKGQGADKRLHPDRADGVEEIAWP